MPPALVHLPNGHNLTVTPIFGGLFFKSLDLSGHGVFPAGWSIIIQTEEQVDEGSNTNNTNDIDDTDDKAEAQSHDADNTPPKRRRVIHPFTKPTLRNDSLFISSISNPSSNEFKPATSPTRQIAMMLWSTLYWYFHQSAPPPYLVNDNSKYTPDIAKPHGDWRIYIRREGVFRGRKLLQKLERMGLIASEDSAVGLALDDRGGEGWKEMFVSQRTFWQLPGRLFLFTLPHAGGLLSSSPCGSRPTSPVPGADRRNHSPHRATESIDSAYRGTSNTNQWTPNAPSQFSSGSHLPTYFPPPPTQYTMTDGIRHPIRPKPPQQAEIFYTRFIPSVGQYLSFRTASMSTHPVAHLGPVSSNLDPVTISSLRLSPVPSHVLSSDPSTDATGGTLGGTTTPQEKDTTSLSDLQLLHRWMNNPRVSKAWGSGGAMEIQEKLLKTALTSKHSFPIIGYWDEKPFGFMEVYWVKEDQLARYANTNISDWDRGLHVLVGEEDFRGMERLGPWMTGLIHSIFLADYRTESVFLEPRVDSERFISQLQKLGFYREKDISFPFKQAAILRLRREDFNSPIL